MYATGPQRAVVHDDAVILHANHHIIDRFHEAVVGRDNGILAVLNGCQLDGRAPGVVVRTVNLVGAAAAGHGAGNIFIFGPGHIVGRIGDSGCIEEVFIVI